MPSALYPGELIFDDSTPVHAAAAPEGYGTGLDYSTRTAAGYAGVAEPFPSSLLIPQSEWQGRLEEMEKQKTRLSDLIIQSGLKSKNQSSTNYCWGNAPVGCVEALRVCQNQPMVELSPASVCAQINGYRNAGGWGRQALEWIVQHGIVPASEWPCNGIDRRFCTPEAKQAGLKYRADEWWALDNTFPQIASCLLRRIPVSAGLSWWGHQIYYTDLVLVNGAYGVRFRNSWSDDWPTKGAGGWSILQGHKCMPDDSCAPRTAIAS